MYVKIQIRSKLVFESSFYEIHWYFKNSILAAMIQYFDFVFESLD